MKLYAYLIKTNSMNLLVDTGVGSGHEYIDQSFNPTRHSVADALGTQGLKPRDITGVINSHLHFDHCGNNALFPQADIFVQAAELEAARHRQYTVRPWFDYAEARLQPVNGAHSLRDNVQLIAAPGHTPGHQAVLVQTDNGSELIAAQAAFTLDEYAAGGYPDSQAHEGLQEVYCASIERLKALQAQRTYFSHDHRTLGLPAASNQPPS